MSCESCSQFDSLTKCYHNHDIVLLSQLLKLRSKSNSIADAWKNEILAEVRGKKRKRTSRIVTVDGHNVLKQNMYSLEEGEPSVYAREAAKLGGGDGSGAGGDNAERASSMGRCVFIYRYILNEFC